jgi:phosphoglycerol transferase MdoB-like AlkP superfamily enzyme
MPIYRYFLYTWGFLGIQHLVYRFCVLWVSWESAGFEKPWRQASTGLASDVFVSGILSILLLIFSFSKLAKILVFVLIQLLLILLSVNLISIIYRNENIGLSDFWYLKDAPVLIDSVVFELIKKPSYFVLIAAFLGVQFLFGKWYFANRPSFEFKEFKLNLKWIVSLLVLIGASRSFTLSARFMEHHPSESHPVTFLYWRWAVESARKMAAPLQGINQLSKFLEDQNYHTQKNELPYNRNTRDFVLPSLNQVFVPGQSKLDAKVDHVVFILAESLGRAIEKTRPEALQPLEKIRKSSLWLDSHFSNSYRTCGADFSALCSMENPLQTYTKRDYPNSRYLCLPKVFENLGYATHFLSGADGAFDSAEEWMLKNGTQRSFTAKHFPQNTPRFSYGVHDEFLFQKLFDELEKASSPTFFSVMTASNHHPYTLPPGFLEAHSHIAAWTDLEKSTYYASFVLAEFLERASRSKWNEKTLFVVYGDHNPWGTAIGDLSHPVKLEDLRTRFKTVAFFKHPKLKPQTIDIDTTHLQLAPTVLQMYNLLQVKSDLVFHGVFDKGPFSNTSAQENTRGAPWLLHNRERALVEEWTTQRCRKILPELPETPCDPQDLSDLKFYRETFFDTMQWQSQLRETKGNWDSSRVTED